MKFSLPEDLHRVLRIVRATSTWPLFFEEGWLRPWLRRLAETPDFGSVRSRRDVRFRPRTVESILSCAMPFYRRVYSPAASESGHKEPHAKAKIGAVSRSPAETPNDTSLFGVVSAVSSAFPKLRRRWPEPSLSQRDSPKGSNIISRK